jgi:ketosteroid isomerase-like protein
MSQENVELLYQAQAAFNRGDIDAALALFDPDVEFTPRTLELEGGDPYRGRDGVRGWLKNLRAVFHDFRTEIDEVRDRGDVTVAGVRLRGQGTESDAPMEETSWVVAECRDKKCIRWRTIRSEAEALEAAGLRK